MNTTTRRAFLARLGVGTVSAAAAICTFDVERLLWVPGERTIVLPAGTSMTFTFPLPYGLITSDSVEELRWDERFRRIREAADRLRQSNPAAHRYLFFTPQAAR